MGIGSKPVAAHRADESLGLLRAGLSVKGVGSSNLHSELLPGVGASLGVVDDVMILLSFPSVKALLESVALSFSFESLLVGNEGGGSDRVEVMTLGDQ